jgi:hypothetical protein
MPCYRQTLSCLLKTTRNTDGVRRSSQISTGKSTDFRVWEIALCALLAAAALSACSHAALTSGEARTITDAESTGKRDISIDWPCFSERSDYNAWLANAGDDAKQSTIEEKSALWLEPGDTVTIQHSEAPDTLQVRIVADPAHDTDGLTCWTPGYDGKLFQNEATSPTSELPLKK